MDKNISEEEEDYPFEICHIPDDFDGFDDFDYDSELEDDYDVQGLTDVEFAELDAKHRNAIMYAVKCLGKETIIRELKSMTTPIEKDGVETKINVYDFLEKNHPAKNKDNIYDTYDINLLMKVLMSSHPTHYENGLVYLCNRYHLNKQA